MITIPLSFEDDFKALAYKRNDMRKFNYLQTTLGEKK